MKLENEITQTHFNTKVIIEEMKSLRRLVISLRDDLREAQFGESKPERVVLPKEAAYLIGVSTSTLWVICEEDDTFPKRIQMTERRCGWKLTELEGYIESKKL